MYIAYSCLLFIANCLLPLAYFQLPIAYGPSPGPCAAAKCSWVL